MNTAHSFPPQTQTNGQESHLLRFTAYLLAGDRQGCHNLMQELLADGISVLSLYQDIFQQSLYRVGELWEQNRISVAREHIATAIVESLLAQTYPLICNAGNTGKKVIVACTPGELHQLGARMVADTLEMYGWDSHFLGANTPPSGLLQHLQEEKPQLLCLSLSTHMGFGSLLNLIRQVRIDFSQLPIAFGGQAFYRGGAEQLEQIPLVRHVPSLGRLEELINR